MNNNTSENAVEAALVIIGDKATVCILAMPESLRGQKFQSVGYDEEGFHLISSDGEKYVIKDGMSADDYDQSCSVGPFMLRGFINGEIQDEEYQVDVTPRVVGMGFGA